MMAIIVSFYFFLKDTSSRARQLLCDMLSLELALKMLMTRSVINFAAISLSAK